MARAKDNPISLFMLTQYLEPQYFNWTPEMFAFIGDTPTAKNMSQLFVKLFEANDIPVESAYGIIHDKDTQEVYNGQSQAMELVLKDRHIHFVCKLGKPMKIGDIAQLLGVEPQYIEKAKPGRHAHSNLLAYQVHAKNKDKYQYKPEEVYTAVGEDYVKIYHENWETWQAGRAKVTKKNDAEIYDLLLEKCLNGELTREQILLNNDYARVYSLNRAKFNDVLGTRGEIRATLAAKKMKAGLFRTNITFVTGHAGAGKSHWAKSFLIPYLLRQGSFIGEDWSFYDAASKNSLDDYVGEEVILMDDLRASAMDASEWLRLLDPEGSSSASARYRNKANIAPRHIVITSSIEPVEFFFYVRQKGSASEALDQFMRRITNAVKVIRVDDDTRYFYVTNTIHSEDGHFHYQVRTGDGEIHNIYLTYAPVGETKVYTATGAAKAIMNNALGMSKDIQAPEIEIEAGEIIDNNEVLTLGKPVTKVGSKPVFDRDTSFYESSVERSIEYARRSSEILLRCLRYYKAVGFDALPMEVQQILREYEAVQHKSVSMPIGCPYWWVRTGVLPYPEYATPGFEAMNIYL